MLKMFRKAESLAFAHQRAINLASMPQRDTEMVQCGHTEIMNIAPRQRPVMLGIVERKRLLSMWESGFELTHSIMSGSRHTVCNALRDWLTLLLRCVQQLSCYSVSLLELSEVEVPCKETTQDGIAS